MSWLNGIPVHVKKVKPRKKKKKIKAARVTTKEEV